jgi:prephenate dehydrogenase
MTHNTFAIIGYGQFGELLANLLRQHTSATIFVISNRDLNFTTDRIISGALSDLPNCDFIFPCVPVSALEEILEKITPYLNKSTVLVDVSSIKLYPKKLLSKYSAEIPVILTHPMFGPGTVVHTHGKTSGLRVVIENISATHEKYLELQEILNRMDLNVIEMSAEDHDKAAARFHFVSQYFSQIIKSLELEIGSIDTESYRQLISFSNMIRSDNRLLLEMMKYNPYCKQQLLKLKKIEKNLLKNLLKI